jgi:hypothetical protein
LHEGKEDRMAKYGRGLNREIVAAVNMGIIAEPFSIKDIRKMIKLSNWKPEPSENHINVTLSNGANEQHSITYKKYFICVGDGQYKVKPLFKGKEWF